jgi:mRNA-degrading endonuclease HigB of HigAB toxin-antitoxin module
MRLFTDSTLKRFWKDYPDAEPSLKTWMEVIEDTDFESPNEVIQLFKGADSV